VTASRRDLGARDGRRQTGIATTVVQAVQEDTYLPVGWLRLQESGHGGASPTTSPWAAIPFPTYLAWAALQLPGVEVEEVPM
jgi:hypothetical protein